MRSVDQNPSIFIPWDFWGFQKNKLFLSALPSWPISMEFVSVRFCGLVIILNII